MNEVDKGTNKARAAAVLIGSLAFVFGANAQSSGWNEAVEIEKLKREQVLEGFRMAAGPRAAVTEYLASVGRWPDDNVVAGLPMPASIRSASVTSVTVSCIDDECDLQRQGRARITVQFNDKLANAALILETKAIDPDNYGSIAWVCRSSDKKKLLERWLPGRCRK